MKINYEHAMDSLEHLAKKIEDDTLNKLKTYLNEINKPLYFLGIIPLRKERYFTVVNIKDYTNMLSRNELNMLDEILYYRFEDIVSISETFFNIRFQISSRFVKNEDDYVDITDENIIKLIREGSKLIKE